MPRLQRTAPAPATGIVHLGLGAFFRAHGALYLAEAMAASGGDWGVLGVSLQSPRVRDLLAPQGHAYTAVALGPGGDRMQGVELLTGVLVAPEDPAAVLRAMADPAVRIVSLTVTEKGYCLAPASGRLDPGHLGIRHDLTAALPATAPGFLVRALALRRAAGTAPFTVLSCDNLAGNGRLTRGVVVDLAQAIDPDLARWIAAEVRFPATVVDRIVPATEPADVARLARARGLLDAAPVLHEPFRQWVVEDDFVAGDRPDLAAAGVHLVAVAAPFERVKLRMLNGAHSALAWAGLLAGHATVAEAVADPAIAAYLGQLWRDEIIPTLDPPPGLDLAAHADALIGRFANPAIRHRTLQIASDSSQKLPPRILAPLAENLAAGRDCPGLLLAVAAWMRVVEGRDEAGAPIAVADPLTDRLRARLSAAGPGPAGVGALLAEAAIFPPDLARAIAPGVTAAWQRIAGAGIRAALAAA